MRVGRSIRWALAGTGAVVALAGAAHAQAWNYPSFQTPRVATREVNFALGRGGDPGESLVVQWRQGVATRSQLSLDVGFASPTTKNYLYADSYFLTGGQFAHQLARADRADSQTALDVLLTFGANLAIDAASELREPRGDRDGDDNRSAEVISFDVVGDRGRTTNSANVIRVPVGIAIGYWFPVDGTISVAPYAHMRASYDYCSACGASGSARWQVSQNVDLGLDVTLNSQLAARLSTTAASSIFFNRNNSFGVSLAWSPGEPPRSRRRAVRTGASHGIPSRMPTEAGPRSSGGDTCGQAAPVTVPLSAMVVVPVVVPSSSNESCRVSSAGSAGR
jgi:hypothetical protein